MAEARLPPSPAVAPPYVVLYPTLLSIARKHGYTVAVHGSFQRDMDLIFVPWVEGASSPEAVLREIKKKTGTVIASHRSDHLHPNFAPTQKPHGRVAYVLHFTEQGGFGPYMDISFMPRKPQPRKRKKNG